MDQELSDEIREHLDERTDDLIEQGMSPADAALAARREFGNVLLLEERGREVWRWTAIENFFADIRYAFRQLHRSPAFALAGVLTLALGIGANTAVFSVVNAVMLRPLPFPEPERLVSVESRKVLAVPSPDSLSYPTFFDFRDRNQVFDHIVSYRDDSFSLTGWGPAEHLSSQIVSWDLFDLLKVQPALGRGFLPHEESAGERVVVLSHDLWSNRFGADPTIVGRAITLDSQPYTVVGVAPAGFKFPVQNARVQLWTTLAKDAASDTLQPITRQRGARLLSAIARLKPGVTLQQAQLQIGAVAAALVREHPDQNKIVGSTFVRPELESLVGDANHAMLILLGAVGLVLLIGCANIANLLLARFAEREREFALRASIGAGRGRIVRQLITESLALSLSGAVAGVLFGMAMMRVLIPLAEGSIPRIQEVGIDARVLAFSAALAILTSLLFGLAPALRAARSDLVAPLKEGARSVSAGSGRLRSALVVVQISLGLVLLSGASLLAASFFHVLQRDLGLQPERILAFSANLPDKDYPRERALQLYSQLFERLKSLPGVSSAATAMPLPLTGDSMTISFKIEGRPTAPSERHFSSMAVVTPEFFKTLGTPLLEGRYFTGRDNGAAPPVLIVNRAFAEKFFPGESAVGKRIEPGATSDARGTRMREIVGVVGNAIQSPLKPQPSPIYYFPYEQLPWCCPAVIVRTANSPLALEGSIRGVVESIDKQLPVHEVRTLDRVFSMSMAGPRFQLLLLGSFAAIALLLMVVGLYGVIAYTVARRTGELGIRMALGASRQTLLGMVLGGAMRLVVIGVAIGLAGSLAVGHLLSRLLYGVEPRDPGLLLVACGSVALAAALAAWIPARRAASIDPLQALRCE